MNARHERAFHAITLAGMALAFSYYDRDTLAATALGGMLALIVPARVPPAAPVALGLFAAALVR